MNELVLSRLGVQMKNMILDLVNTTLLSN